VSYSKTAVFNMVWRTSVAQSILFIKPDPFGSALESLLRLFALLALFAFPLDPFCVYLQAFVDRKVDGILCFSNG
jgi:hypothetical protein